jgi:hypothetical protein
MSGQPPTAVSVVIDSTVSGSGLSWRMHTDPSVLQLGPIARLSSPVRSAGGEP